MLSEQKVGKCMQEAQRRLKAWEPRQQANEKGNRGKSSGKEVIAEPGAEMID